MAGRQYSDSDLGLGALSTLESEWHTQRHAEDLRSLVSRADDGRDLWATRRGGRLQFQLQKDRSYMMQLIT